MGLTPLEGVVHGTRSGDVDPAIFGILTGQMGMSPKEVDDMLWNSPACLVCPACPTTAAPWKGGGQAGVAQGEGALGVDSVGGGQAQRRPVGR